LSGCGGGASAHRAEPVLTGFTCDISGTYRGEAVAGHLTRSGAGLLRLTVDEPTAMTMEWSGGAVTLSLGSLSVPVDPDTLPAGSLGGCLLDALDKAQSAGLIGSGKNGAYALAADPKTGYVQKLSIPSLETELVFQNVNLL